MEKQIAKWKESRWSVEEYEKADDSRMRIISLSF